MAAGEEISTRKLQRLLRFKSEHQGLNIPRLNENLPFDDIGREQE